MPRIISISKLGKVRPGNIHFLSPRIRLPVVGKSLRRPSSAIDLLCSFGQIGPVRASAVSSLKPGEQFHIYPEVLAKYYNY